MKPSAMLTSQVEPRALFLLAYGYVRYVGRDAAIATAVRLGIEGQHVPGNAEEQAAAALWEAVEIADEVRADNARQAEEAT